jgi:hypothetical protein
MNRRVVTLLAMMVLAFVVYPAVTYAQESTVAEIGFQFVAGGQTMPPGTYELTSNGDTSAFTLTPVGKGSGVVLLAITRLAAAEPPSGDIRFVFDKVGDTYYLSEAWLLGQDGFLFYAAKEKHTHQTIRGQKKYK